MDIVLWQKKFYEEVKKTFAKSLTSEQRLLSIFRQVADASMELAKKKGLIETEHISHISCEQSIANIFVDLFVLCEEEGVELEQAFEIVLEYFKERRK